VVELWYLHGMLTTIDKSGRLVIPKALRDSVGLTAGEVELTADGAGIRVAPVTASIVVEKAGRLVIPSSDLTIDDEMVQELRDASQR